MVGVGACGSFRVVDAEGAELASDTRGLCRTEVLLDDLVQEERLQVGAGEGSLEWVEGGIGFNCVGVVRFVGEVGVPFVTLGPWGL